MTKTNKTLLLILPIVFAATACGTADFTEEFNDAPRGDTNDDPADIITMPDGFGNLASKCDGPNRVYSARAGGDGRSVAVVANDPRCEGAPG